MAIGFAGADGKRLGGRQALLVAALEESRRRSEGDRGVILSALEAWVVNV